MGISMPRKDGCASKIQSAFEMSPSVTHPKISLKRIAHVYYTHADLEETNSFLLDFGLTMVKQTNDTIYYRGYGSEPFVYCAARGESNVFGGTAFVVDSFSDLELATQTLPLATPIHDLDAPGGGKRVIFYDPVDNCPFHLVYGQAAVEPTASFPELEYNFPTSKHRPANKTQRFKQGPAPVHKLGHFGLCVTDFAAANDFFTSRFNFKPSDVIYDGDGRDITAFMHLDRGEEMVDHHSFFFFEGPKFHVHHSSFEVHDFDTQSLGHQWLEDKKYKLAWGVGRHVLGSQIFDYW